MLDATGVPIEGQFGMQHRGHHEHARMRLEQQLDLAHRDRTAAHDQCQPIPQVQEYRQIVHTRFRV